MKKGDIVFNHLQTESLLNKGYVTGRGKALAQGNARSGYLNASTNSSSIRMPGTSNAPIITDNIETVNVNTDSSSSKSTKASTNDNIYNEWDAHRESMSSTLSYFRDNLDNIYNQYEQAVEQGNDEAAEILRKRLTASTEKYAKNFVDTHNELALDLQDNLNALVELVPEYTGMSALEIINDKTLQMQIQKKYEDAIAAATDEDAKSDLQNELNKIQSYTSSLESTYSEMMSMEAELTIVWDQTKLKKVTAAIEDYYEGELSGVSELAAQYGYESAQAFVDAWNNQDEGLLNWFRRYEYNDSTAFQTSLDALEKKLSDNEFTSSLLEGDVNTIEQRIALLEEQKDILHEMANLYRENGYDDDSEEIRELQEQWRETNSEIAALYQEAFDAQRELIEQALEDSEWILSMYGDDDYDNRIKETNNQIQIQLKLYNQILSEQKELDRQLEAGLITWDEWVEGSQELKSSLSSILSSIKSLAESLKQMEIDKIQDQIDEIQETTEEITDELQEQIDALEEQKELLEDELEAWGNALEAVKKVVNEQIDALEESKESAQEYWDDQIDAVKQVNTETERTISLLEAKARLEQAQSQKTSLIYSNGKFVYMANQSDVDDARSEYEDTYREISQERAIELLEEQRDLEIKSYEDRIEALQNYLDKLNEVTKQYSDMVNDMAAQELLGVDYQAQATSLSLSLLQKLANGYYRTESTIEGYINKRIEALEDQIEAEEEAANSTIANLEAQITAIENTETAFDELYAKIVELFKVGDYESIPGLIQTFVDELPSILAGLDWSQLTEGAVSAILGITTALNNQTSSGNSDDDDDTGSSGSSSGSSSTSTSTSTLSDNDKMTAARNFARQWASEESGRTYYLSIFDSKTEALNSSSVTGKLSESTPYCAFIYKSGSTYYVAKAQYGGGTDAPTLAQYAKGTDNAKAGLALVGENGAELMAMNGGETVVTADKVKSLISGMEDLVELNSENSPWYDLLNNDSIIDLNTLTADNIQNSMLHNFINDVPTAQSLDNSVNSFSIGEINMHGVNDADGLLDSINRILPGMYLQRRNSK